MVGLIKQAGNRLSHIGNSSHFNETVSFSNFVANNMLIGPVMDQTLVATCSSM